MRAPHWQMCHFIFQSIKFTLEKLLNCRHLTPTRVASRPLCTAGYQIYLQLKAMLSQTLRGEIYWHLAFGGFFIYDLSKLIEIQNRFMKCSFVLCKMAGFQIYLQLKAECCPKVYEGRSIGVCKHFIRSTKFDENLSQWR